MIKTTKLEDTSEWLEDNDLIEGVWIHYKGHNIPRDVLQKELESDWLGYIHLEDAEEKIEILETKEDYYYCTRYQYGDDAQEHGYKFWIEFIEADKKKKTSGHSTNVKFKINIKSKSCFKVID